MPLQYLPRITGLIFFPFGGISAMAWLVPFQQVLASGLSWHTGHWNDPRSEKNTVYN